MEKLLDTIIFRYSDQVISEIIGPLSDETDNYPVFFSQNEDQFIRSATPLHIPAMGIHHDVESIKPSEDYLSTLRTVIESLSAVFPALFTGTRYYFDPAEVLRPCFIQVFKSENRHYLYLLRLDLNIRLAESRIINPATNDMTADFETERLYFENMFLPINKPEITSAGGSIPIERLFKSTWVGETGAGYHLNGEWIDHELTKMLSALYLPPKKKSYPYYPFRCDFNTVAFCPPLISPKARRYFLGYFHRTLPILLADLPDIEAGLKEAPFSRDLPLYLELKKKIADEWTKTWSSLKISPYLNENEMREYRLEYEL